MGAEDELTLHLCAFYHTGAESYPGCDTQLNAAKATASYNFLAFLLAKDYKFKYKVKINMKTHQSYPETLRKLASELVYPERFGDLALQDTIEFDPIVIDFPPKNPQPEHGWGLPPAA